MSSKEEFAPKLQQIMSEIAVANKLDLSSLSKGIYILRVNIDKKELIQKIIKM